MIKRWAIRENSITDNSIYLLGIEGSDDDARMINKELSGFVRLIDASIPPFNHIFELSHISDDDMLEKIRIRIEQCISHANGAGLDVGVTDRTSRKVIDLDGVSPSETVSAKGQKTSFMRISRATSNPEPVEIPPTEILSVSNDEESGFSLKLASEDSPVVIEDGAVSLADGDISIRQDLTSLEPDKIELENDLDVGDGTFINLNAADVKQIQENTQRVGAASLTGLLGGKVEVPALGEEPAPKAQPQTAKEESRVVIEGPTEKTEHKSIFRNIFKKFGGGKDKTEVSPNVEQPSGPPTMRTLDNAKQSAAPSPLLQVNTQAAKKTISQSSASGGLIMREAAKKRTIFSSPKKEEPQKPSQIISKAPSAQHSKVVGNGQPAQIFEDAEKAAYVTEDVSPSDIFSTTGTNDDLMAKMPVDDIFAAETIIDFYANNDTYGGPSEDASTNEISNILKTDKTPSQAAPERDFIEPPNLLGASAISKNTSLQEAEGGNKVAPKKEPSFSPSAPKHSEAEVKTQAQQPQPVFINTAKVPSAPKEVKRTEQTASVIKQSSEGAETIKLQPAGTTASLFPRPAVKKEVKAEVPSIPKKVSVPPAAPHKAALAGGANTVKPPIVSGGAEMPPPVISEKRQPMPVQKEGTEVNLGTAVHSLKNTNVKMAQEQNKMGDNHMSDEKIEIQNLAAKKRDTQSEPPQEQHRPTAQPASPASTVNQQQRPAPRPAAVPSAFRAAPQSPARPVIPGQPAVAQGPKIVPPAAAPRPFAPNTPPTPRVSAPAQGVVRPAAVPQAPRPAAVPQQRPPVQQAAVSPKPQQSADSLDATQTIDHTIQIESGKIYKKSNWPIEMPLIPTYTFDSMDMSSNRFVHATAMALVDNLGVLNNPFLVYGESGTGKTHFLNAFGYEISKKIGQDKIFYTNGVRLARGIQRYVEEGRTAELEEFLTNAQVLIVDDVHLTAVNNHNREYISKLLNTFLQQKKQIIMSSKYSPESLSRFEELVKFRLDQGWLSEIKAPRPQHFAKIYNKMVEDSELDLKEVQSHSFFGTDSANLGAIARNIRRVKVLHRMIIESGAPARSYEDILMEMMALSGEDENSLIIKRNIEDVTTIQRGDNKDWGSFGFFFPEESSDKFKWLATSIMQKAKELGIKGGFDFALKSAYSTQNVISSAFKIANICDNKNLKGAIILGPALTVCPPAIRENFYDILTHMLEVMNMRCGIVDPELIKHPSSYIKVLGDVLK